MKDWFYQIGLHLRLYFRNKIALLYGYLFPTIFLVAFWVLYRHEQVPLVRHMGELLTVTVLGGACFGLPTSIVSERERGVWRRYRVAPVSTARLLTGTIFSRYVLLLTAGLLQLVLAMGIGMPLPQHVLELWLAFTIVSFAFVGLGLVIAMLADNVPAVQALGQCIFLPMLIIGGVAVRLESLPAWAQHISAFFPGRYAVETIQVSVTGDGLETALFSLAALIVTGLAGCVAGTKLFRWEAGERFVTRRGKAWVGVALAAWIAVGLAAEAGGRIAAATSDGGGVGPDVVFAPPDLDTAVTDTLADDTVAQPATQLPADTQLVGPAPDGDEDDEQVTSADGPPDMAAQTADTSVRAADTTGQAADTPGRTADTTGQAADMPGRTADRTAQTADTTGRTADAAAQTADTTVPAADTTRPTAASVPESWQAVTMDHIDRDVHFDRLPSDEGVVAPIATSGDSVQPDAADRLQCLRSALPFWRPGRVADPVQRVRNFLYVAAVPDMFRLEDLERWVPVAVYDHVKATMPTDRLIKVLYWIATHPEEGDDAAAGRLSEVCINVGGPSDVETLRERTTFYALKLLGRLTGKISPE